MRTSILAVILLVACSDDNNTVDQGTDLHASDLARIDGALDTMSTDQSLKDFNPTTDVSPHEAGTDLGITCTAAVGTAEVSGTVQGQALTANPNPKATGGTVTLTAFDGTCGGTVKGSFALEFGTDTVTGSFDTVGCGTIAM